MRAPQLLALAFTLLFGLMFASAAAADGPVLTINTVEVGEFPHLTSYAVLTDANEQPIANLPASAFQVFEDDVPVSDVEIQPARNADVGIIALLLMDVSGSMKGQPLEQAVLAGEAFLRQLGPRDQCAVMAFSTRPRLVSPFTNDKAFCAHALQELEANGWTALFDSAGEAVNVTATGPRGRHVVIMLSDGRDEGGGNQPGVPLSTQHCQDVVNVAVGTNVPIYTIGVGQEPQLDTQAVQCLAEQTGGRYHRLQSFITDGEQLVALYESIALQLRNQYQFVYTSKLVGDGKRHTLRIVADTGVEMAEGQFSFQAPLWTPTPSPTPSVSNTPVPTATFTPTATLTELPTLTPLPTEIPPPPLTPLPTPIPDILPTATASIVSIPACLLGLVLLIVILVLAISRGGLFGAASGTQPEQSKSETVSDEERKTTRVPVPFVAGTVRLKDESKPSALLIGVKDPIAGKEYQIKGETTNIGRDASNDILLDDNTVSRVHARIRLQDGDFYLYDMDSANGTRVNDEPIAKQRLNDGDRVQIGAAQLRFRRVS